MVQRVRSQSKPTSVILENLEKKQREKNFQRDVSAANALRRREHWLKEIAKNENFADSKYRTRFASNNFSYLIAYLKSASIVNKDHPANATLRDHVIPGSIKKADMYVRTYETAANRAGRIEKESKAQLMDRLLWNEKRQQGGMKLRER